MAFAAEPGTGSIIFKSNPYRVDDCAGVKFTTKIQRILRCLLFEISSFETNSCTGFWRLPLSETVFSGRHKTL